MARAPVTVTKVSHLTPVPMAAAVTDAANDMQFVNDGHTFVLVINTGASARIAQAVIIEAIDGVIPAPIDYNIPAGPGLPVVLGPWDPQTYGSLMLFNTNHADLAIRAFTVFAPPM
jgi:hypothetical protein